jgi:hypothetical protein
MRYVKPGGMEVNDATRGDALGSGGSWWSQTLFRQPGSPIVTDRTMTSQAEHKHRVVPEPVSKSPRLPGSMNRKLN